MISLLSIQDVRGHGLPGTPVSRVRERLRRGVPLTEGTIDTALGRDLDRLASRLEKVRARVGSLAQVKLNPALEDLIAARSGRMVRSQVPERKRA